MLYLRLAACLCIAVTLSACTDSSSGPGTPEHPVSSGTPELTAPEDRESMCGRDVWVSLRGVDESRDSALAIYSDGILVHLIPLYADHAQWSGNVHIPGDDDDTLRLHIAVVRFGGTEEIVSARTLYRHIPLRLRLEELQRAGTRYLTDAAGLPLLTTARPLQHVQQRGEQLLGSHADWYGLRREADGESDTVQLRVDHGRNLAMYRPVRFLLGDLLREMVRSGQEWRITERSDTDWRIMARFTDEDGCPMPEGLWPGILGRADSVTLTVTTPATGATATYAVLVRGAVRSTSAHIGGKEAGSRVYQYDVEIHLDDGRRDQAFTWTFWCTSTHTYLLRMIRRPIDLELAGMRHTIDGVADYLDP
jgi:hypothetical protein